MVMDNKEIERMFTGFKEDIGELKVQLKDSIDEGKKEHEEIKIGLGDLCDRMKDAENTIDNHLINTAKREKTKREKILLVIAVMGSIVGIISIVSRLFL